MSLCSRWTWVALLLIGSGLAVVRWHSLPEPMHTDLTTYALVGHQLLHGGSLYHTAIDMKPPGIYWLFAAAEVVAGNQPEAIVGLGIVFSLISLGLVFHLLRSLAGSGIALLGSLFWTLASASVRLHANLPATELFINTFLLAAMAGMLAHARHQRWGLWLVGTALVLASLIKTNVFLIFLAYAAYMFVFERRNRRTGWQSLMILAAPGALVWAAVFAGFFAAGHGGDFFGIVFRSLLHYAGNGFRNEWRFAAGDFWHYFPGFLDVFCLWVLAGLWLVLGLRKGLFAEEGFLVACLAGGLGMIGTLANGYIIYYQILLPMLVLMAGLAVAALGSWRPPAGRIVAGVAATAAVAYLACFQIQAWRLSPEEVSKLKYGPGLVSDLRLAHALEQLTDPQESIYQWGMASGLNYYSHREPGSGLILHHLLYFSPRDVKARLLARVKADLAEKPPAFLILTAWSGDYRDNEVFRPLQGQYRFFGCYDKYLLFERIQRPLRPSDFSDRASRLAAPALPPRPWETPVLFTGQLQSGPEGVRPLASTNRADAYGRLMREGNALAETGRWPEAFDRWVQAHYADITGPETKANQGVYYERTGEDYMALSQYQIAAVRIGPPWDAVYRDALMRLVRKARQTAQE